MQKYTSLSQNKSCSFIKRKNSMTILTILIKSIHYFAEQIWKNKTLAAFLLYTAKTSYTLFSLTKKKKKSMK